MKSAQLLRDSDWAMAARSVGEVVIAFQNLDETIRDIVGFLINPDSITIGKITTAELSFKQLLNLAACLAKEYSPRSGRRFHARWSRLLAEAGIAEEKRNSVVHSSFGWEPKDGEPADFFRSKTSAKMKRGLRTEVHPMNPPDARAIIREIGLTRFTIECLFSEEFPGWRNRSWVASAPTGESAT